MTTAAKADDGASRQPEGLGGGIFDCKLTFQAKGSMIENSDLHSFTNKGFANKQLAEGLGGKLNPSQP